MRQRKIYRNFSQDFLMQRRNFILTLTLLAIAAGGVAHASIFARLPRSPVAALERLGGQSIQRTSVQVNGVPGSLTLLGFDESLAGVGSILSKALEDPKLADIARGTVLFDWPATSGQAARVVLLAAPDTGKTLALVVDLPADAPDAHAAWPWPDIGVPPSQHLSLAVEDRAGHTSMVVGESSLTPHAARAEMAERLATAGWQPATPAADVLTTAIFARGAELLLMTHLPLDDGNTGTRTLLLRRRPR